MSNSRLCPPWCPEWWTTENNKGYYISSTKTLHITIAFVMSKCWTVQILSGVTFYQKDKKRKSSRASGWTAPAACSSARMLLDTLLLIVRPPSWLLRFFRCTGVALLLLAQSCLIRVAESRCYLNMSQMRSQKLFNLSANKHIKIYNRSPFDLAQMPRFHLFIALSKSEPSSCSYTQNETSSVPTRIMYFKTTRTHALQLINHL